MHVRANIRSTAPAPMIAPEMLSGVIVAATMGVQRDRRQERRALILGFISRPQALDDILPGLSTLKPGPANDRLRALRYSEQRMGAANLRVDSTKLGAALVALRILCFWEIHGRR